MFVLGFCSVLSQEKLHPDISQFYLKIFKSLVTILKVIQAAQAPVSISKKSAVNTAGGNEENEQEEEKMDDDDLPKHKKKKVMDQKLNVIMHYPTELLKI